MVHAKNRESVVVAITLKNNLQQQVDDTERKIQSLMAKADKAEADGDAMKAAQIRRESASYEPTPCYDAGFFGTGH